ncbi:MAG: ribonuclease H-like YkuK family protein [Saprospiraceae bacterium]
MMEWRKFNGQKIKIPIDDMVESAIISEIQLGNKLKICIGSDSQVKSGVTEFASVIVFVREKKGGYMYFSSEITMQKMTLKERMIKEVAMSVQLAYSLCHLLDKYHVELEVHADINTDPSFKSNIALKDAMGYILGMGFVFKAKPEAFASSCCADRVVQ